MRENMHIIRNYIRGLLLETLAIDSNNFVEKLNKFSNTFEYPERLDLEDKIRIYTPHHNLVILEVEHTPYPAPKPKPLPEFDSRADRLAWFKTSEGKAWKKESMFWRPPRYDREYVKKWHKEVISYLKKQYTDFAESRGWNVLQVTSQVQPVFGPIPVVMTRMWFDQKPNVKVSGFFGDAKELQETYYLYHMTSSSSAEKIMSSGFKVLKKSTDGKMFGNGRGYFVAIEKSISKEDIITFFKEMQSEIGFAGKKHLQTVLKIDLSKVKRNIKFYKDSEWSQGTGKIPTKKTSINAIAVYTPTFIGANTIMEVIDL